MVLPLLLACLFCPLAGLVLDSNTIRGSAEVQSARKGSPCQKDQDCSARHFCLSPDAGTPFCTTCRGLRRRCQGSAMCCPGIMCVNDVCAKAEEVTPVAGMQPDEQGGPISNARVTPSQTIREKRPKKKPDTTPPQSTKGQEGESCLRSLDCATGLCCARHFWSKICKPVLIEGQVCSGRKHKDIAQRPEIFQRCDCGPGLSCRPQTSAGKQKSRLRVCQRR